jgi:hypothetical protein
LLNKVKNVLMFFLIEHMNVLDRAEVENQLVEIPAWAGLTDHGG